jgi:hypothetical protein
MVAYKPVRFTARLDLSCKPKKKAERMNRCNDGGNENRKQHDINTAKCYRLETRYAKIERGRDREACGKIIKDGAVHCSSVKLTTLAFERTERCHPVGGCITKSRFGHIRRGI